jgi:NACalpha-BTF3-like transcription factor
MQTRIHEKIERKRDASKEKAKIEKRSKRDIPLVVKQLGVSR